MSEFSGISFGGLDVVADQVAGLVLDEKVKISDNDSTSGYLNGKLLGTTNKVVLTENNDGGPETLSVSTGDDILDKAVSGQIDGITEKTSFADNDVVLIEDSADTYAKKKVKKSNLLAGFVVGPASANDSNITAFDTATGKLVKDGGIATSAISSVISDAVRGPGSAIDSRIAVFDNTTGKLIKDSGIGISVFDSMKEPTGFITGSPFTLSFDNGTRTLTITGSFTYLYRGILFSKTGGTKQITTTAGTHYIYYDAAGVLQDITSFWDFSAVVPVAMVYWNSNTSTGTIMWEAHGLMPWQIHRWLHLYQGTQYQSGLTLSGINLNTSTADTDVTFQMTDGIIEDEDLEISISHAAVPTNKFEQELRTAVGGLDTLAKVPVMYIATGGSGNQWIKDAPGNLWFKNTAAGRINYNNASAGTQVEVSNTNYVAYFIIATNDYLNPVVAVQGQREDTNLTDCRNNNVLSSLLTYGLPFAEFRLLYIILCNTNNSYGTTGKMRVQAIDDHRVSGVGGSVAFIPTNHASLTNLGYDLSGHTGFGRLSYSAASTPGVTNDGVDTAALGRIFRIGDSWINTSTKVLYVCTDNTTGAAVWRSYLEKTAGDINGLTEKLTVANDDVFVMNDSANSYAIRKIKSVNFIPVTKGKILFDSWAGGLYIPSTSGASHQVIVGTNRDAEVHVFPDDAEYMVGFAIWMPPDLASGETINFEILASAKITENKNCAWKLYMSSAKTDNTESWDLAFTTKLLDDQALTTAKYMKLFTITDTAANLDLVANDWVRFRLSSPSATNNQRTDDLYLHGLVVRRV